MNHKRNWQSVWEHLHCRWQEVMSWCTGAAAMKCWTKLQWLDKRMVAGAAWICVACCDCEKWIHKPVMWQNTQTQKIPSRVASVLEATWSWHINSRDTLMYSAWEHNRFWNVYKSNTCFVCFRGINVAFLCFFHGKPKVLFVTFKGSYEVSKSVSNC